MKRTRLILAAAGGGTVVVWAQQASTAAEPPRPGRAPPVIDIVEKVKDFGVVAKGEKLQAVFEVRNTGQAPLEITQVRPTCGCTVADFDKTIAPGGTGKIGPRSTPPPSPDRSPSRSWCSPTTPPPRRSTW